MSTPLETASALSTADIQSVSPALGRYAKEDVAGLWQRPQLSRRDRSLVTVAILIARNQTLDLPHYINLALDSGVTPRELSETITHLAFYSGWSNAMAAVAVTKDIFAQREIGPDQLPAASPQLMPLNEQAEANRVAACSAFSEPLLRASTSTPPIRSSRTSGCAPTCRHATAAS